MSRAVFRVDASCVIGSGHVVRCATLAEQLRCSGWDVRFICRDLPGNFNHWLAERGFDVQVLPAPSNADGGSGYKAWLGVPMEIEIAQALAALHEGGAVDWLVVDHYALGSSWERTLRGVAGKVLALDDLADREHDCDMLLDQNYSRNYSLRYQDLVPPHCIRLLGPDYALLRSEFHAYAHFERTLDQPPRRILVFFGGADSAGLSGLALEALLTLKNEFPVLEADVVLGAANQSGSALLEKYAGKAWLRLHVYVSNMAELMCQADCAIGAGGGTLWERCLLALPSVVVIAADNQKDSCEALADTGAIYLIGAAVACTTDAIAAAIRHVLSDPDRRAALSQAARAIMRDWAPNMVRDAMIAPSTKTAIA